MEAVIPIEIGMSTARTTVQGQRYEYLELERHLDWANEVRGNAAIRMTSYQQRAITHYNQKVRPRAFNIGTLVLKKVFENTAKQGAGKLQANWEEPYVVSRTGDSRAYHLQTLGGTPLLRPWNVCKLKQYYQ